MNPNRYYTQAMPNRKWKTMKCVICNGNEVVDAEVKEMFTIGNDIVYVPITVYVCGNCGERYYNRRTMRFLEEMKAKLIERRVELKEIGKVLLSVEV